MQTSPNVATQSQMRIFNGFGFGCGMIRRAFKSTANEVSTVMQRRDFVKASAVAATSLLPFPSFAQNVASCCSNVAAGGTLTQLLPISVAVDYVQQYGSKHYPEWRSEHKAKIEEARSHFAQVWSSTEFKTAVTAVQEFIWQDDATMSGADLYSKLTGTPEKKMQIAAGNRSRRELAISYPDGETLIELHYLDDPSARISDFVHTLSHEYTHYTAGVESWDRGHSGDITHYVSYGIGCITQKLAFPNEPCAYEVDTKITGASPHMPSPAITTYTLRQALPKR